MKKRICILTATRAEYGLLKPIILKLQNIERLEVLVVATGAHLSLSQGYTLQEIEQDGISVDRKIEILLSSDTGIAVSKAMGLAMISFSEYFEQCTPDLLLVLGDRYETLAVCCVASNMGIPIAHMYGGETTEGAIDESIRHAITKLSHLHFTSTELYRKRVIQMGESPERVFNIGAMGVENALHSTLLTKKKLELSLDWELKRPYGVVTFHPVTLETGMAMLQVEALLNSLDQFSDMQFIITKANADAEGAHINQKLETFANTHQNARLYDSLGVIRYLSALKYSAMVIGNSSSGLIEAPSFQIPTINIGDRQKGRLKARSVIDCPAESAAIEQSIRMARSPQYRSQISTVINPYGNGNTSNQIVSILYRHLFYKTISLKKKFFEL
ncbi:MAG: UDP-N-acetylglucosamine 2-epimerase [Clostridium sp.]|nr:UDP-N-acetylglucosamine 2-epimerase [Clostridium sp.]